MSLMHTQEWFREAVPMPNRKNVHVQIGVHLEEVVEMMDAIKVEQDKAHFWYAAIDAVKSFATQFKTGKVEIVSIDPHEFLDGLTDQIVTATGCGHMLGMDISGALHEVNASNFSKFVDGKAVFDENGKIKKGPTFFKPNLRPYLPVDDNLNVVVEYSGVIFK